MLLTDKPRVYSHEEPKVRMNWNGKDLERPGKINRQSDFGFAYSVAYLRGTHQCHRSFIATILALMRKRGG